MRYRTPPIGLHYARPDEYRQAIPPAGSDEFFILHPSAFILAFLLHPFIRIYCLTLTPICQGVERPHSDLSGGA
jgi:hypothetical protein